MKRLISLFSVAVLVALAAPAAADFTATGTFQYEDLPIGLNGFQSPHPTRPCRYVDVRVVDNTTHAILAQGATDANGAFSIAVTDAAVRDVAILALTQSANVSNLGYYITQWLTTAVYAYQGTLVSGHDPGANIDMGAITAHYRAGGEPFNLYDATFDAHDCIGTMQAGVRPLGYRVRYTLDESPDQAYWNGIVNIGGNFGYDDTILLHETGHAICSQYGVWSDSPGGGHYFEDNAQDPRLSWGEAWPTFFCGNVRDWAGYSRPDVYLNSTGDSTTGVISFSYTLEAPTPATIGVGAASEVGIQASLWDMTDGDATPDATPGVDDEPGYQMDRTFPELWSFIKTNLSQPPFVGWETYEDFHDLWLALAVPPQATELGSIEYLNHGIQYWDDAYENDDTFAAPGTYHTFEDIGFGRKTHHTTWPEGDEDWVKFQGLAGVAYQVNTNTMRDGADTYVEIQNASQTVLASNDNAGVPSPGTYNTFELLRSTLSYTPLATQDLWLRVRRSSSGYGTYSKYGNWDLTIKAATVPATYPNITLAPPTSVTTSLEQNKQGNVNLVVGNTGTVDSLVFGLTEGSAPIAWVSESLINGTVPPAQNVTSVLTFDATGLAVGYYTDSLEISCNDPNAPLKYLKLNFTVTAATGSCCAPDNTCTATTEATCTGTWTMSAVCVPNPCTAESGVEGFNLSTSTWLGENSPNPATPKTAIRFSLGRAGHARLAIYDVQGREVVRLLDGTRPAGEQAAAWNGRDQNQQPVPGGVYFYRLEAEGRSFSRRLVIAR